MQKKNIYNYTTIILLILLSFNLAGCAEDVELDSTGYFDEAPGEYYLNYYIAHSPVGLSWEKPSTLARDLLRNAVPLYLGTSTTLLGHINIELGAAGKETIYAGMSFHEDDEGFKLIFRDKSGLGLLFHNMAGSFDSEDELNNAKKNYIRGKASIITFTFGEERYSQLKSYLENYMEKGEHFNYGLYNNPFLSDSKNAPQHLLAQFPQNETGIPLGAGCTAFGVSVLQELGVSDMHAFEQWHSSVRAPEELIGQHSDQTYSTAEERENLHPLNRKTGKKVSMWKIIFSVKSWAEPSEPGKDIVYYCPDRMFAWVNAVGETASLGENILSGELKSIEKSPKENSSAYRLTVKLD